VSWERVLADTTATHGPQGLALHLDIGPEPTEVRRARDFVRVQLAQYDEAELDVVTLLLSELLTNAILHGSVSKGDVAGGLSGGVALDISVHLPGVRKPDPAAAILVGVTDASAQLPAPRAPRVRPEQPLEEHGLGLQIVGQLSDGWGTVSLDGGGKIVWFLVNVRVPETTAHARAQLSGTRPPA
jgi:hypothetical protein